MTQQAAKQLFSLPMRLGEWDVRDDCQLTHRMLKKAVQHGRSERRGEAYPCGT
jgi:hypothetical protein